MIQKVSKNFRQMVSEDKHMKQNMFDKNNILITHFLLIENKNICKI